MKALVFAIALCFMMLPTYAVSQPQIDCPWLMTGCSDPWTSATVSVWVEITAVPPCSAKVTAFYAWRCNDVEVQDLFMRYTDVNPPGCITPANMMLLWGTPAFMGPALRAVEKEIATARADAIGPTCCPCPNARTTLTSKYANCRKCVVQYVFPDGSISNVDYNPMLPWSYYATLYSSTGGVAASTGLVSCSTGMCCYRSTSYCRLEGVLQVTHGEWQEGNFQCIIEPCIFKMCQY